MILSQPEIIEIIKRRGEYEDIYIRNVHEYSLPNTIVVNFLYKKYGEKECRFPVDMFIRLSDLRESKINKILG